MKIYVVYEDGETVIETAAKANLLQVLRENNITISSPCGGMGTCGKCRINITEGEEGVDYIYRYKKDNGEVFNSYLACGVTVNNDLQIFVRSSGNNICSAVEGEKLQVELSPIVNKIHCKMAIPSMNDQRDDRKRLSEACGIEVLDIDLPQLSRLNSELKRNKYNVTALVSENKLLNLQEGNTSMRNYAVAVDLGTTTIACYLVDLNSGNILETISQGNKQASYGADVISRINYVVEKTEGLNKLRDIVIVQLNEMIDILSTQSGIKTSDIGAVVTAGNTTMVHLLLGIDCSSMAEAPYTPTFIDGVTYSAKDAGLCINGILSVLPGIAPFVGGDITAGISACGMDSSKSTSILLDLGTNGEIVLRHKDRLLACSTAIGPAFEGASIKFGMPALEGAISEVNFDKRPLYRTIGNKPPKGICGSAVVDITAEMLKHGALDETGRIVDIDQLGNDDLRERMIYMDKVKQFLICNGEESDILFTQKDIRQVQMAKAAVNAGIRILLKTAEIGADDVESVYLSGGFGNFINIESALRIGLIPEEFSGKIKPIGNSAGTGAVNYALSKAFRVRCSNIREITDYIELSESEDFQGLFMEQMNFKVQM